MAKFFTLGNNSPFEFPYKNYTELPFLPEEPIVTNYFHSQKNKLQLCEIKMWNIFPAM